MQKHRGGNAEGWPSSPAPAPNWCSSLQPTRPPPLSLLGVHRSTLQIFRIPILWLPLKLQSLRLTLSLLLPARTPTFIPTSTAGGNSQEPMVTATEGFLYEPMSSQLALLSAGVSLDPHRSSLSCRFSDHCPCGLPWSPIFFASFLVEWPGISCHERINLHLFIFMVSFKSQFLLSSSPQRTIILGSI